jgi:hypothetical protein
MVNNLITALYLYPLKPDAGFEAERPGKFAKAKALRDHAGAGMRRGREAGLEAANQEVSRWKPNPAFPIMLNMVNNLLWRYVCGGSPCS